MTTPHRTFIASSAATLLLAGLLVGCGSSNDDGSIEAFCSGNAALDESILFDDIDSDDPNTAKEAFSTTVEQAEKVKAPSDIEDDWSTMLSALSDVSDGMQDLDLSTTEGQTAFTDLMELLTADGVLEASDNVDTFMTENCDA
jgi:hypothetical protein